ncbi:DNA-binding transcriptional regulator, LysR family [Allokutzneria albata]|uniref:DNA-binding transcriptional regulator, LysR family n=1 Tax=Allokutzneria albata TaxID=211114 RepID=A0A1G9U8T6_ALLAB|nr:DNA-binding transcriptional regulator, LysR family [Allokutzneria albata]
MYWKFLELVVASLHQFRCFLAAARTGSFTAAAAELGMAQQSVSEQVRLLERTCGVALFIRVGRGLRPTEAAHALTPHAERALAASEQAVAAARAVRDLLTGTVRLGVFGTIRYYVGADLVASVLTRHPGLRVEIVGQNSAETVELIRSGAVEAGIVALPVDDAQLSVQPVLRDEVLYVTADADRAAGPVTAERLAAARLVLPYASWAEADTTRRQLAARVQAVGSPLRTIADVDDVETTLELAAQGLADTIANRGILRRMADRVPPNLITATLRPRMWDSYAIVHRRHTDLSPATRAVLELALDQLRGALAR